MTKPWEQFEQQKLDAELERARAEIEMKMRQQQMRQAQNQYIDPRDYMSPYDYQQALRNAQQQADVQAGQQNMRQGLNMTATQMRAQQMQQRAAMQRAFVGQQARQARAMYGMPENPQEVVPPRATSFFVPDTARSLGPKLWRKEISAMAHFKLGGLKLGRATLGIGVIADGGETDVRPYVNAALAALTHHVRSVERMSISIEHNADLGPGMQLHLVEVSRKAANVLRPCEFEQRLGSMYCLTHRQNAVACLQAQRNAGTLGMSVAEAIKNIEPQQSPFLVLGKKMFNDMF